MADRKDIQTPPAPTVAKRDKSRAGNMEEASQERAKAVRAIMDRNRTHGEE
jgi:hypothetical protein